jgi:hypothetical protein
LIDPNSWFQARPEAKLMINQHNNKLSGRVMAKDADGGERKTLELDIPPPATELFSWLADKKEAFQVKAVASTFNTLTADQHLQVFYTLVCGGYLKQLWYRLVTHKQ